MQNSGTILPCSIMKPFDLQIALPITSRGEKILHFPSCPICDAPWIIHSTTLSARRADSRQPDHLRLALTHPLSAHSPSRLWVVSVVGPFCGLYHPYYPYWEHSRLLPFLSLGNASPFCGPYDPYHPCWEYSRLLPFLSSGKASPLCGPHDPYRPCWGYSRLLPFLSLGNVRPFCGPYQPLRWYSCLMSTSLSAPSVALTPLSASILDPLPFRPLLWLFPPLFINPSSLRLPILSPYFLFRLPRFSAQRTQSGISVRPYIPYLHPYIFGYLFICPIPLNGWKWIRGLLKNLKWFKFCM